MLNILYVYHQSFLTSFSLVSKKHIEYIRKLNLANVYEMDDTTFSRFVPVTSYSLILHPWTSLWNDLIEYLRKIAGEKLKRYVDQYVEFRKSRYDGLIGFDVCDSDAISEWAVSLLNHADMIFVPSRFCRDAYESSGVKTKVYVLPHGVDPEWYSTPNITVTGPREKITLATALPYMYKMKTGKKMLLFWLWHSGPRKGFEEVLEVYERLKKERDDVFLVIKTSVKDMPELEEVEDRIKKMEIIHVFGWASDYEKMFLYDSADITLLFSRAGAFEINCLESLARGTPCIAHDKGSWVDYLPEFLRVKTGEKIKIFERNIMHTGYGYKIDVENAVDKIHDILDNYDDYKAKVEEYRQKVLYNEYRWDYIVEKMIKIIGGIR